MATTAANPVAPIDYKELRMGLYDVLRNFLIAQNLIDSAHLPPRPENETHYNGLYLIVERTVQIIREVRKTFTSSEWLTKAWVVEKIITKLGLQHLEDTFFDMDTQEQGELYNVCRWILDESHHESQRVCPDASDAGQEVPDGGIEPAAESQVTTTRSPDDTPARRQQTRLARTTVRNEVGSRVPRQAAALVRCPSDRLTKCRDSLLCIALILLSARLVHDFLCCWKL